MGPVATTTDRFSTITPEDYKKIMPTDPSGKWVGPTDTTRFANLPGGGQYAIDKANQGKLIKTQRPANNKLEYEKRNLARSGMPAQSFEVDHILPLALGGTDTDINKEVLNTIDHDKKTAVGAIAQHLFFTNKISLPEAQNMVFNWRDKNVDGVQVAENGSLINTDIALPKVNEWKQVPKVGIKDWWNAFKDLGNKWSQKVDDVLPETAAGEFGKGLISSITLGWVDAKKGDYKTNKEELINSGSRLAGQIAGFAIPWKLGGLIIKTGASLGKMAAGLTVGGKAVKGGTGTVEAVADIASGLSKTTRNFSKTTRNFSGGKIKVPSDTINKAFEGMETMALLGQLSKQEENTFEERTKRFITDMAFGALMGPTARTWKGVAGLGTSTYIASSIAGLSPAEALLNTGIMVGAHSLGKVTAKDMALRERQATDLAQSKLKEWGVEPPTSRRITLNEKQAAFDKISEKYSSDPDAINTEKMAVILSDIQNYTGGLSQEMSLAEKLRNMESLSWFFSRRTKDQLTEITDRAKNNFNLLEAKWPTINPQGTPETIRAAGYGIGPKLKKNVKKLAEEENVIGRPALLVVEDRPEIIKAMRDTKKYTNPDKNIRVITRVGDDVGTVGWVVKQEGTGELKNATAAKYNLPQTPVSLMGDALYDKMLANNTKFLPVKISYISKGTALTNRESPSISFEIHPEYWNVLSGSTKKLVEQQKQTAKTATQKIPSVKNSLDVPAHQAVVGKDDQGFLTKLLEKIDNDINTTPEKYVEELQSYIKTRITDSAKKEALKRAKQATLSDLSKFFYKHKLNGTLTEKGESIYGLIFHNKTGLYGKLTPDEIRELEKYPLTKIASKIDTGELPQGEKLPDPDITNAPPTPNPAATTGQEVVKSIDELPASVFQGVRRGKTVDKNKVKTAIANRPRISVHITPTKTPTTPVLEAAKRNNQIEDILQKLEKDRPTSDNARAERDAPDTGNLSELDLEMLINNLSKEEKFSKGFSKKRDARIRQIIQKKNKLFDAAKALQKNWNAILDDGSDRLASEYLRKNGIDPNMITGPAMGKIDHPSFLSGKDFMEQISRSAQKTTGITQEMWNSVQTKLAKKLPGWEKGRWKVNNRKMMQDFNDEQIADNVAGKQRGINQEILKYGNIIRSGGEKDSYLKKLPEELKNKLLEIRKKYPNTRFTFSPTVKESKYPLSRYYNVYKDVRDFVYPNSPVEERFSQERLELSSGPTSKKGELEKIPKKLGLSSDKFSEYIGNLHTDAQLQEQKTTNFIDWLFSPVANKEIGEVGKDSEADIKAAINRVTDDIVMRLSSYFVEDKSSYYNPNFKKYSGLLDRIMAEQAQKKGMEEWKRKNAIDAVKNLKK